MSSTTNDDAKNREATIRIHLLGAFVALTVFAALLTVSLALMAWAGATDKTLLFVGKAFTYTGVGAFFIGWKWPYTILVPFRNAGKRLFAATQRVLAQKLLTPVQRGLFAVSVIGVLPWLSVRLVPELWESSNAKEYLKSVFYPVVSPMVDIDRWGFYEAQWYDWFALLSIPCFILAFAWPSTGARLLRWIRSGSRGSL